jgi:hypothetical protein
MIVAEFAAIIMGHCFFSRACPETSGRAWSYSAFDKLAKQIR